jgi:CRP-like cAMP-binding protein
VDIVVVTLVQPSFMFERLQAFLHRFVPFTEEEFSHLKRLLIIKHCRKKEVLIHPGQTEQYLYFVDSGLLHQYFFKGKEVITTDIISEGTITGAVVSFLSGQASHYNLEALEPSVLLALSKDNLEDLYKEDRKWQKLGRILISYFLLRQERHNLDMVRYTVRERFIHFAKEYSGLMTRVPQKRLASYLNIEPETFTRLKPLLANEITPAGKNEKKKKHDEQA